MTGSGQLRPPPLGESAAGVRLKAAAGTVAGSALVKAVLTFGSAHIKPNVEIDALRNRAYEI